jgi:hypothetical protein
MERMERMETINPTLRMRGHQMPPNPCREYTRAAGYKYPLHPLHALPTTRKPLTANNFPRTPGLPPSSPIDGLSPPSPHILGGLGCGDGDQ